MATYRKSDDQGPSADLARLAEEGRRRIEAADDAGAQKLEANADWNLRQAIGAVRGSTLRRLFLALMILALAALVAGLLTASLASAKDVKHAGEVAYFIGLIAWIPPLLAMVIVGPTATKAQVEKERRWVGSLPFALEGYFEAISAEPRLLCRLKVELEWKATGADQQTLQGLIGLVDTAAHVTHAHRDSASLTTGDISGATSVRVNRRLVLRNHHVLEVLEKMVRQVLLPLHGDRALSRVRVSRV